jgi:hypothetical protein
MSEHIEDYSHLVQQVELRHGIDRKGAAEFDLAIGQSMAGPAYDSMSEQFAIRCMPFITPRRTISPSGLSGRQPIRSAAKA